MAAQLKGNLGLKSSPLAPTACKLSTQYLVLDHMTNHYNKIAKAKSAIDSKPPKSLSTSQKLRDRKNREKIKHSPRTRPTTSLSHDGFQTYQDVLNDEPEDDDEERLVHSIMKSTLLDKGHSSTTQLQSNLDGRDSRFSQTYGAPLARPSSARSVQSGHSLGPSASRLPMTATSHDPTRITYQGDVLEKRPYLFTEPERPFTPRTLKNNHQSRLKNSKCYNPPPVKTSHQPRSRGGGGGRQTQQPAPEVRAAPRPQPRSGNGRRMRQDQEREEEDGEERDYPRRRDSFHGLGETMETTGQLSESMLMDITLRSRDGRHQKQASAENGERGQQAVPPLAISMDQDHMHWLQEQASKAQVRARSRGQLRASPLHSEEDAVGLGKSMPDEGQQQDGGGHVSESIKRETMQKEEDQKYLAFAKEVTDDVLSRGICTDSVLHRVFENHIERKKEELDVGRMRQVINDLRRDLGLRDSSAERTPHAALSDANYNNRSVTAPVTVVTNGESGGGSSSNNQLPSGSSKATTTSTSAKDESSSTFSPGNHYRRVIENGGRGGRVDNNGTSTILEPLHVMSSPSENNGLTSSATLESVSSFKFGQTGDMVDTITSEAIQEDTAREREEEEDDRRESETDELSATQALKQYEFDLTVKEGTAEQSGTTTTTTGPSSRDGSDGNSGGSNNHRHGQRAAPRKAKLERPATGERRVEPEEQGDARSESASDKNEGGGGAALSAKGDQRFRRREEHRLRKARASEDLSQAESGSETNKNSSEESTRQREVVSVPVASARSSDVSGTETSSSRRGVNTNRSSSGQVSGSNKQTPHDDDEASVKSSASSVRPAVPPRTKLRRSPPDRARVQDIEAESEVSSSDRVNNNNPRGNESQTAYNEGVQSKEEDYEDDYEDVEDEVEDDDYDESTHRTSDDDF